MSPISLMALMASVAVLVFGEPTSSADDPARAPAASADPLRLRVVRLRSLGVDQAELIEELEVRLPDRSILPMQPRSDDPPQPHAWVELHPAEGEDVLYEVTVVTSDGRGYARTVEVAHSQRSRVMGTMLANLLLSIEAGSVKPDRSGVEIPPAEPQSKPDPVPESEAASAAERRGHALPRRSALDLGFVAGMDALAGVGPPTVVSRFAGWGGHLAGLVRTDAGVLIELDLRVLGRRAAAVGLVRTRISAGAGYSWVRGRFELATVASLGVEPWRIVVMGRSSPPRPPPLLGGALRLSPAYRIALTSMVTLRLGLRAEIGLSGVPEDGLRVATVVLADDEREAIDGVLRAGGWELGGGFELGILFGLPTRAGVEP